MVSWLIICHILFGIVIYSAYHVAPRLIPFTWAPEKGHYLTHDAYIAFVGLMVTLQASLAMDARLCSTDADSDSSIRSSCAYSSPSTAAPDTSGAPLLKCPRIDSHTKHMQTPEANPIGTSVLLQISARKVAQSQAQQKTWTNLTFGF